MDKLVFKMTALLYLEVAMKFSLDFGTINVTGLLQWKYLTHSTSMSLQSLVHNFTMSAQGT